jgi:hypothetical protein
MSMKMTQSILNKLLLARRLNALAMENSNAVNDISLCIGINLLQDAVESFLLAVAEYVDADFKSNVTFDKYFDLINAKIAPKTLPFQTRLVALNKLRVNSKHYGLIPAKSEVDKLQITVREFFDEVASSILERSFATISLIDLLRDDEAKELLGEAENAFVTGNFENCLIGCRKAIFVRIESKYDISPFETDEKIGGLGLYLFSRAPFYARNKEYIENNVTEPTDFIVFDHNDLEMDLMTMGIDSVSFWNVWRLTPDVFRRKAGDEWIIKKEFSKLENKGILERAEYVLDTTINLFVTADQKFAKTKSPEFRDYKVTLRQGNIPIYKKADTKSELFAMTPSGLTQLPVDYIVPALNGTGNFYHITDVGLWGYISEDAIIPPGDES